MRVKAAEVVAIRDEQDVDHGVGLLRGFDGVPQLGLGPLILTIGEHDHGLAAGLAGEFVLRRLDDGVVEQGAARGAGGQRAGGDAAGSDVDLRLLDVTRQHAGVRGEVGEQVDIDVEGDEEGLVFLPENALQKFRAGLLLQRQNILLRAGGVEQDAEGERLIDFRGEVLELLRLLVLEDLAVVAGEMRDQQVLFVADIEVERDEIDVLAKGGDGLRGVVVGVGIAGQALGRGIGRGSGLRVKSRCRQGKCGTKYGTAEQEREYSGHDRFFY